MTASWGVLGQYVYPSIHLYPFELFVIEVKYIRKKTNTFWMVEAVHPIYNSIWDSPGAVAILLQPGHDLENKDIKRYQKLERFTSYRHTRFVRLGGFPYANIFASWWRKATSWYLGIKVRSASVLFVVFFEELREVTGVKALLAGEDDWNDLVRLQRWYCFLGKVLLNSVFLVDANQKISRWTPTNLSPTLHLVSWMIKWLGFLKKPHLGWGQNGNK